MVILNFMRNLALLIVLMCLFLASCDQEEVCTEGVNTMLVTNFYQIKNGSLEDTIVKGLTVFGLGIQDSLLYDSTDVSQIMIPLDPEQNTCSFILQTHNHTDTLTLEYTSEVIFVSYACGFAPGYDITNIVSTYQAYDSLHIVKSKLTPDNEENIEIYF